MDTRAVVEAGGLATITKAQWERCVFELLEEDYEVVTLDCGGDIDTMARNFGVLWQWETLFGYTVQRMNLDAIRDGLLESWPTKAGRLVLVLVNAERIWKESRREFLYFLDFAREKSRWELALGTRFFTLLVVEAEKGVIPAQGYCGFSSTHFFPNQK